MAKAFSEWVTEDAQTFRLQVRPHTYRDKAGFLITGRYKDSAFPVKIFTRKRETADAMVAAMKAGQDPDKLWHLDEDAAVNSAGGGAIAGLGVGPQGEPGGIAASQRKKKKNGFVTEVENAIQQRIVERDIEDALDEGYNELAAHYIARLKHLQSELGRVRFGLSQNPSSRRLKKEEGSHLRRITREFNRLVKISEAVEPQGTFAGADIFEVGTDKFMASRFGKNRYHRYSRYVGEDETGESIRQHGRTTKRDIILKDGTTGAMIYLRRKAPK